MKNIAIIALAGAVLVAASCQQQQQQVAPTPVTTPTQVAPAK